MSQAIQEFVHCQTIAVVGASRAGNKFGNMAYRELRKNGYDVLAVHPQAEKIEGDQCYPSLRDLPREPEGVLISLPPDGVPAVLREAAAHGIRRIWLQQGAESPEALALAAELGLNVAHHACILMYMQPVRSFHAVHRGVMKLFGRCVPTDRITPQMVAERRLSNAEPRALDALSEEAQEWFHSSQAK